MFFVGSLAIAPILGAGLAAAGASLVGGILNSFGQSKANKTNLQAVRETNAQNAEIARAQLQQQQQQFEEQLKYLSPAEQRKMLQEAGFNPYAYLSGGQTSSAGTPHTGVSQQMVPGHVDPITGFGNSLQELSANIRNIAEAKKLDSERKGQDLQNETFMVQFEKTMEALGYSNKIAEVKAKYAGQEEEQFYKQLIKDNLFKQEEIERVQIANKIQREYNEKIQPQELNKLLDEIELLKEEKVTQQHLQSYYDAAGKAGLSNAAANNLRAWIEGQKMPYEIQESVARTKESGARKEGFDIENSINKMYGASQADANVRKTLQDIANGKVNAVEAWKRSERLQQEMDLEEFKQAASHPWFYGAFGGMFNHRWKK